MFSTLRLNRVIWIYSIFVYDSYWRIFCSCMSKYCTINGIYRCNNIVVSNTISNINGVCFATILCAKLLIIVYHSSNLSQMDENDEV